MLVIIESCVPFIPSQKHESCRNHWNSRLTRCTCSYKWMETSDHNNDIKITTKITKYQSQFTVRRPTLDVLKSITFDLEGESVVYILTHVLLTPGVVMIVVSFGLIFLDWCLLPLTCPSCDTGPQRYREKVTSALHASVEPGRPQ